MSRDMAIVARGGSIRETTGVAALFVSLVVGSVSAFADSSSAPETKTYTSPPHQKIPFPEIVDQQSVEVRLSRGGCLGPCPAYEVTIHGDGTVTFRGEKNVIMPGEHVRHINATEVGDLLEQFRQAEFFDLQDSYKASMTDQVWYTVSIAFDGQKKVVEDYVGRQVGMPAVVTELETTIDKMAGTGKWVNGNGATLDALRAEGRDLKAKTPNNFQLVQIAAEKDNFALVYDLLEAGVPVSGAASDYGCRALNAAARFGNASMVDLLVQHGAALHGPRTERTPPCDPLHEAAAAGVPRIVQTLLKATRNINVVSSDGTTALHAAATGYWWYQIQDQDLAQTVRLIIAAGANVNTRDKAGETALMKAREVEVVQELLKAGADPHLKDKNGHTALDIARDSGRRDRIVTVLEAWEAAHPPSRL